tara:strand:+ start:280 stop:2310 length:2031 start_codon:yes stop_codon:yes gene_type:complete
MANTIDKLIIQIEADTKQLKKELKQIEGKIRTTGAAGGAAFGAMGGASGALAGSLKKLAGPAAIGAVALGFVKLGKFSASAGMEFEDLKDSLDTVFGSVEAGDKQFDRILRFAQTTPFQIDTVTKAFISLGSVGIEPTSRMMQVFADTASVAVDQRGAFEALIRVVQRAEAGALGLQELNMLADRGIDVFKGLKDELGLSRLELTDFGQTAGGAKIIVESLTNVLEKQFGGAMVNKMDNLSTAISNMQIAFKSLGNEIFESGVGDFFRFFVDQAASAANAVAVSLAAIRGEGLGISLAAPTLTGDMTFEEMQNERAATARKNIQAITTELAKFGITSDGVNDIQEKLILALGEAGGAGMTIVGKFKIAIGVLKQFGITEEESAAIVASLNDELINQKTNLENATKSRKELTTEEKAAMLIAGKNVRAFGLLEKSILEAKGDTELFTHAQTQLNEIFEANSSFLKDNFIMNAEELGKAFEKLEAESNKLSTVLDDELRLIVVQTSHAFATDFVNALMNSESALESFKNFAQNMVAQILSTFLQLKVINPILNNIFGAGTFSTGGGGSGGGSSGGGIGLTRAGGGTVQRGMPTLVGERGAEIFVPHSAGTIMNNMNSKNAVGGGTTVINQSINFATGVVPTVRAEVMKMMPQIADVTKGAVAESAMRGGNFRRALQGG